jgi:peptidoglycan/xylan/chitin deacetylase (PgdA/CDA1 family)/GT2 family glycosyltransferase
MRERAGARGRRTRLRHPHSEGPDRRGDTASLQLKPATYAGRELLVDEVLAVGDTAFQRKRLGKKGEDRPAGADRRLGAGRRAAALVAPARLSARPVVRFSVVIPTFERRELAVRAVSALEWQSFRDFETIVVVDGSSDGTAEALRSLEVSFPLLIVEQPNLGAAAARNAGAAGAHGALLLFLDDDMEADPELLAEHERSHAAGADIVLGHLPLHPASPPSILTPGVERWTERRRRRLAGAGSDIPTSELITGQLSVAREKFGRLGGFDLAFTRDGAFGGEDVDFGHRARQAGLSIAFNQAAVSFQYYDVDPAVFTRRSCEAARAAQELAAKHPEHVAELGGLARSFSSPRRRAIMGRLAAAPSALSPPLVRLAIALARRSDPGPRSRTLFFDVQAMEQLRGARVARRALGRPQAVVLAYHAISDLRDDPVLREYGLPHERLAKQLDMLRRRGWRFVGLDELLQALGGAGDLPARSILVTFDDAYADLLTEGWPVLAARGIPAVVFPVSRCIGGTNEWDVRIGARELRLLDEAGLRELAANGIAIGSHGATHRPVTSLQPSELATELRESAERIAALGLPAPTVFAYPHGRRNHEASAAVREAGYAAAFTVSPGVVRRTEDRYALPRIEAYASDTPLRLWLKLVTAAWPDRWRTRLLGRLWSTPF